MTILMFNKDEDNVVIMMDTLATTLDGQPHLFMTKTHLYPHLGMAMATTGLAQLGNRWAITVQDGVLARDIEMLNLHAPDVLRRLWSELDDQERLDGQTATVYHFGLSEITGKYVGYAYRSTDDFRPDLLMDGFCVKPVPQDVSALVVPDSLDDWVVLALKIRKEQEGVPADKRLYIGGELVLTILAEGMVTTRVVHRFDDYDTAWNLMNDRLADQ